MLSIGEVAVSTSSKWSSRFSQLGCVAMVFKEEDEYTIDNRVSIYCILKLIETRKDMV